VLWKQDVDLGFTLVDSSSKKPSTSEKESSEDEIEKLKALKTINATSPKVRTLLFLSESCPALLSATLSAHNDHARSREIQSIILAASNERLFIASAPLSAFTRVTRKRPRPRFERSFLRVCQRGPLMSSCVPRAIIEHRKPRMCTCVKNSARRRARFPSCLSKANRPPIGLRE